jgi:MoaA/NifB/PqqE/SkfB family radical SAM enzyme
MEKIVKVVKTTCGNVIKYRPENVKLVETDEYVILFNPKTGEEILTGINGHKDPFALDYPSMLDIGIMGHCDNKCEFCYQGDKWEENMSLEGFKLIIDQSKDHVNQVALGGRGDPNQHENFEEILDYCVQNNIVPNYTTSGIGLSEKQIAISKEYCGAVAVSMYNKVHTWLALRGLMYADVKTNIHFVVTKDSIDIACRLIQGEDMYKNQFALSKLNAIVFLLFKPAGRGAELDWSPTTDQLAVFAELIKKPDTKFKVGMDSCLINKVAQIRKLTAIEEMYTDTCEGGRMSCYITPDERLVPCSFGNHDKYGRDISGGNLQEVWKKAKPFNDFRYILIKEKACCPYTVKGF